MDLESASFVRYYMDTAIAKSGMVADVLSPYVQDPNNKPDDRIMKQMVRLFGKDDVTTAFNIFSHFDPIRHYVWVDMDNRSDAWKQTRDQSDLEVHCDAGYIVPDTSGLEPNIHWHDDVQDLPIVDGRSLLQFQDEATTLVAVTSPALPWKEGETWPSNRPEVVTLHPSYIHKAVEKNMIFNSDRIKKALHPSLLKTIKAKFQRFTHVTKIDVLDTPELTFIHEVCNKKYDTVHRATANQFVGQAHAHSSRRSLKGHRR
ncbi:hypothetical protein AK830_g4434 [Neonectria ditissima]|uniref:Uncharacterized protein n=1 Tax=Neonectria ditissima TaxID=78410 RepID=A0A0P7BN52_9HYPO|nr:hypothetical protein AK830_g4434 [Neonectria ditissima]